MGIRGSYKDYEKTIKSKREGKMKEKDIQRQILEFLNYHGIFAFKVHNTGIPDTNSSTGYRRVQLPGISDIIGLSKKNGKFIAIEVKVSGNKPTFEQLNFIKMVTEHNGIAFVCHNLEELEIVLRREKLI